MLAAKCVVVLVSYHPISCFIRALRNSCLIRNTLQTFYVGLYQGHALRRLDIFPWYRFLKFVSSIFLKPECESLHITCLAAARLKQVTKMPLATQSPRERLIAEYPNLRRIFTQNCFNEGNRKVSDQDIVSSISSRSCGAAPNILEFCKLSRFPDRSSFTKL